MRAELDIRSKGRERGEERVLPAIAFAIVAAIRGIYYDLWYPIGVALVTAVIGALFVPETHQRVLEHHSCPYSWASAASRALDIDAI